MRPMGRHSYEIYLTHMFVVFDGVRYFSVPLDRALRRFLLRRERLPMTLDAVPVPAESAVR